MRFERNRVVAAGGTIGSPGLYLKRRTEVRYPPGFPDIDIGVLSEVVFEADFLKYTVIALEERTRCVNSFASGSAIARQLHVDLPLPDGLNRRRILATGDVDEIRETPRLLRRTTGYLLLP